LIGIYDAKNQQQQHTYKRYREGKSQIPIITFCKEIDVMLGGGIRMGEIIEICGVPGIGKTQFGIQLAVDAQVCSVCVCV
jgi:RecA/RadA recombinase